MFACCMPQGPPDAGSQNNLEPGKREAYPETLSEGANGNAGAYSEATNDPPRTAWAEEAGAEDNYMAPPTAPDYSAPAAPAARGGASPAASAALVSWDLLFTSLEEAEQLAYGEIFMSWGGNTGVGSPGLGLDNQQMRAFISDNTSIVADELDIQLLKAAPECEMSFEALLHVIRDNANNDSIAIEQFMGLSTDGDSVSSEECRNGLLVVIQRELRAEFSDARWDQIFTVAMRDAGVVVNMEEWFKCVKRAARIVRLARVANASD